ncbi:hypothetical protein H4R20_004830, partial [Coemansia guatemalensis]
MTNRPEAQQLATPSLTSMQARGGENTERIVCVTGTSSPEEGASGMGCGAQWALCKTRNCYIQTPCVMTRQSAGIVPYALGSAATIWPDNRVRRLGGCDNCTGAAK